MNILTFDIEEWFHLLDNPSTKNESSWNQFESRIHANIDRILTLLSDHNQVATFFCLGWIAQKYPDVIKAIHKQGHEIGSHSYAHQLVYEQKPVEFREDLERSLFVLEDLVGSKITLYRCPGFSITKECFWAFDVISELGIECDCSIFPANRNHGGVSDFPHAAPFLLNIDGKLIKELPMNVYMFGSFKIPFSGGGYFRLLPYPIINHMTKASPYVMTYFHPRDFDESQPVLTDLSYSRKFRSYYGLAGAYQKLDKLIGDNEFISVRQALAKINWQNVPVHNLSRRDSEHNI